METVLCCGDGVVETMTDDLLACLIVCMHTCAAFMYARAVTAAAFAAVAMCFVVRSHAAGH